MSSNQLKCKTCLRAFKTIGALRRHYEEHSSTMRHCNLCGATYRRNNYHRC